VLGADTDSERAIRWLIALMVLWCDPLAIVLTAAASARRSTNAGNHIGWAFDSRRADAIERTQRLRARTPAPGSCPRTSFAIRSPYHRQQYLIPETKVPRLRLSQRKKSPSLAGTFALR
jgi:hypothetical protein